MPRFEYLSDAAKSWAEAYEESGDIDELIEKAPKFHYHFELAAPPPAGLSVYVGYLYSPYES